MGLPIRPIGPLTSCHHPKTVLLVKMLMTPPRSATNRICCSDKSAFWGDFLAAGDPFLHGFHETSGSL